MRKYCTVLYCTVLYRYIHQRRRSVYTPSSGPPAPSLSEGLCCRSRLWSDDPGAKGRGGYHWCGLERTGRKRRMERGGGSDQGSGTTTGVSECFRLIFPNRLAWTMCGWMICARSKRSLGSGHRGGGSFALGSLSWYCRNYCRLWNGMYGDGVKLGNLGRLQLGHLKGILMEVYTGGIYIYICIYIFPIHTVLR